MPQPLSFRYQIWKGLAGASLGLFWLVAMLLMMAMRYELPDPLQKLELPSSVLGINVVMGLALFAYSMHLLVDRRAIIQFDERGVTDLRFSPDPVPWDAITGWREHGSSLVTQFVVLYLDPRSGWYRRRKAEDASRRWRYVSIRHPEQDPVATILGWRVFPCLALPVLGLDKRRLFTELARRVPA